MIIGYARTSTAEQVAGFEAQIQELKKSGCEKIFKEQVSSVAEREQLEAALDFVREGDVFVVTKMDRLARSIQNLLDIVQRLKKKGVILRILNIGMDINTPTGKMILQLLGVVAEFEREIMLERQKEGIAKAKEEGKFKGRQPIPDDVKRQVIQLAAQGTKKEEIRHLVKTKSGKPIGRATVFRILAEAK